MVNKTNIYQTFMSFTAMIERQFSANIKIVQSDNGTEFNRLLDYFSANGIMFQKSCVGTPQQNGRVERKNRHILNVGGALLFQSKLPIYFRGEAILTAVHLINRTSSPLLNNQTPYEILFNKTPSYNTIKTFGCLCFAHNLRAKGIISAVIVENTFLWDMHLERRDRDYSTLTPKNSLCQGM